MNCEHVFDVLTRGPFPAGDPDDDAVLEHLEVCPSCHRLAEALRPALELFQEAVSAEEGRDLPGFWVELNERPRLIAESSAVARIASLPRAMQSRVAPARAWLKERSGQPFSRLVAATMIAAGAVLVVLAAYPGRDAARREFEWFYPSAPAAAPIGPAQTFQRASAGERTALASLLRSACFVPPGAGVAADDGHPLASPPPTAPAATDQRIACCNDCHRRDAAHAGFQQLSMQVAQSCSVCHRM